MLGLKKQSALTLTAVQVTGATSLPVLYSAIHLYDQYGFFHALWLLFVINILTWLAALAIIQMTVGSGKNTLENSRDTIGFLGGYLVAIILILSTVAWFVLQTNLATEIIRALFSYTDFHHINTFIQVGVGLGIVSTLVSMEGIVGLRWITLISFPLIILSFLLLLFSLPEKPMEMVGNHTTLLGLAVAIGTSLSVAVDYPTFFQHSRSKRSSLTAIAAIQSITFLIGVGGLFLGRAGDTMHVAGWVALVGSHLFFKLAFLTLVIFSCICVNAVNIYAASIGWEVIVPILAGRKEYTILGLGLTSAFVLTTQLVPLSYVQVIAEIGLSNLCLVLIIGYLSRLWSRTELSLGDQLCYLLAWLLGSVVSLGALSQKSIFLFGMGFGLTVLICLVTLCVRKIVSQRATIPPRSP